ncbi:MAG: MFS transporter [Anaerolineales bacterium]
MNPKTRFQSLPADLQHNLIVNVLDGGFFGLAIGLASFVTVIPLFVSTLTDSALLIGLVGTVHTLGWQLPQIFTARRVARLPRFKPAVMFLTIHECLPFLLLAVLAWQVHRLSKQAALVLTFLLLIWQGIGGGVTAVAWQSMIGHIIPARRRGVFFGTQAAAASLLLSGGAVIAGQVLERGEHQRGFVWCFGLAGVMMMVSYLMLGLTREEARAVPPETSAPLSLVGQSILILRTDRSFGKFLLVRSLLPFGLVGLNFYAVYAATQLQASDTLLGWMTAAFALIQVVTNPLMGWLGDKVGYTRALGIGTLCAAGSAGFAWLAPSAIWLFPAYALAGFANAAAWPLILAMTLTYGSPAEQQTYIGLANTLIAPATLLASLIGGEMANLWGYPVTFAAALVCSLAVLPMLPGLDTAGQSER